MGARTGDYSIGLKPSPLWRWLFLALLLHALFFMGLHRTLWKESELQVASGDNAGELELEEAVAPAPMAAPSSTPIPPPAPTAPERIEPIIPKADDFVVPKSAHVQLPTSSGLKQPQKRAATSPSSRAPHQMHPKADSTQHQHSFAGGRVGSAGNGKATYLLNPEPPYPETARDAQIEGTVELRVSVSETGNVTAVRLAKSSGDPSLDQSALHTVRTLWKFHPAINAGIPVSSEVLVPITFRISDALR
jgi:protein TonB